MAKPAKKRGVRIPYVRDATGQKYGRDAIDVKPTPPYTQPLTCWECGIPVHVRHGNADDPDSTSSHYAKNPGKQHGPRCPYDLERRAKELVEASGHTVVRTIGPWRLICPPLARSGTRDPGKKSSGPAAARPRPGGGPARTSQLAGQAIASARRIVRLLDAFEQDPAAVAEFAATTPGGGRTIPWPQFCRGREDVHQLAQDLIDHGRSVSSIPRAVWGPAADAIAVDSKTGGRSYAVQYTAAHPVLVGGRSLPLLVVLRSRNPDWIGATTGSGRFLGYGYWRIFPAPENVRSRIELQLWIDEPWQADRWDTDGTTQAFPPAPPPPPRHPTPSTRPAPTPPPAPARADESDDAQAVAPAAPPQASEDAGQAGSGTPTQPVAPPTGTDPESTAEDRAPGTATRGAGEDKPPTPPDAPEAIPSTTTETRAVADEPAEDSLSAEPPGPSVPPMPTQPPRPAAPPPVPRRRRLPGWFNRRGKRR
ncbi:hypothetical protein ACFWMT_20485 [Streptomyces sp. NPDC058368]|uniref:hypothetical protein n=1 Tax=Streptomyces sp. NPDC058368 TaxID=3346461 RepID=UPI0036657D2E